MANFPGSLDSLSNPSSNDTPAAVPHASQHATANDILEALEAKMGTGASTPTLGDQWVGTGTGTSGWRKSPVVDARDFGPLSTATDDATIDANAVTLTAALTDALADGYILYLPEGTFTTTPLTATAATTKTLQIFGAGRTKSVLKPKAGTGTVLTLAGPLSGCRFRGFGIDGTGGTGHGLYYAGTGAPAWIFESAFEDLSLRNCALIGLYVKNSFANRYVNIFVGGNGTDQMRVWGGPADHYERIDVGDANTGYSGLRLIRGGTMMSINGIYNTANADGTMLKLGGDGTAESDSITAFPYMRIVGGNFESFTTTAIHNLKGSTGGWVQGISILPDAAATDVVLIQMDGASETDEPLNCVNLRYNGAPGSWKNNYPIHSGGPVVYPAGYSDSGGVRFAYRDSVGAAYESNGVLFGTKYANVPETLRWIAGQLQGFTDIAYLAHYRMGAPHTTNDYHDVTAKSAMPTTGTWRIGDIVWNTSHTLANVLKGTAGSQYLLMGWRRLTDGSNHVLNTDWAEIRTPTGT